VVGRAHLDGEISSWIASDGALDKEEPRSRGDHDRGNERKWREGFRLLQWLRCYRLLVVPKAAAKSECSRNDDCASK